MFRRDRTLDATADASATWLRSTISRVALASVCIVVAIALAPTLSQSKRPMADAPMAESDAQEESPNATSLAEAPGPDASLADTGPKDDGTKHDRLQNDPTLSTQTTRGQARTRPSPSRPTTANLSKAHSSIGNHPRGAPYESGAFNPGFFGAVPSRMTSTFGSAHTNDRLPRWIDEVRAQRQALSKRRRKHHESRLRLTEQALDAQAEFHRNQHLRVIDHLDRQMDRQRRALLGGGPQIPPPSPPPDAQERGRIPYAPMTSWLGGPWATSTHNEKRPVRMPRVHSSQTSSEPAATDNEAPASQTEHSATGLSLPAQWDNHWYYRGW